MMSLERKSRRAFLKGAGIAAGSGLVASMLPANAGAQANSPAKGATKPLLPQFEGFGIPAEDRDEFWSKVRSHFSLDPQLTFLNNGTLGPASDFVVKTREYYDTLLAKDPTNNFRVKELAEVRAGLASVLNAKDGEASITHATTEGMNIFAHGLDWKAGDEVIVGDQEHFGATEPYKTLAQRIGIKIVTVKLPVPAESVEQVVAAYAQAFTPRTRVLVVSHVSYVTGLVAPLRELAELAHKNGALITVDGAQSFGVLPVDVAATNIDHFAGSGQKWFLAGTGTGVHYVRKDLQASLWPLYGYDDPGQKTSTRYERSGQFGIPASLGLGAAVQFYNAIGSQRIADKAIRLGKLVRESAQTLPGARVISSPDPALQGNINVFTLPSNLPLQQVVATLGEQEHIVVRSVSFGQISGLRVSTHYYNNASEVERLFAVLARWSKDPSLLPPTEKRTS
jgi:selenocysteine lyase/cysteine desulfurase